MTLVVLRPNGTISNTGTVTGAGGVAHTALSDDSDSSTVAYAGGQLGQFNLTDLTLPAGAALKTVAVRGRTNIYYLEISLISAGSVRAGGIGGSKASGLATYAFGSPVAAGGPGLTDPDLDGAVLVIANNDTVSGFVPGAYEAYVDVRYVVQPVVSVSAPTGTLTTTNTPTVTWADTLDADGGAQTNYQVKIFTAAQYGIGGFDPAVSPNTFDSGALSGSALSYALTQPLANATYRAYVRVGQTVNGATLWSAYAFSGFIENVTPPAVPTLALTAQSTSGRIQAVITTGGGATTTDRVELQRSVDGGTTWLAVRNTETVDGTITYPAAPVTILDYEAPNGTLTSYRARALHNYSGLYAASNWSTTATATWTSSDWWIKHPNVPALNLKLPAGTAGAMVSYPDVQRAARQTAFQPLGATLPIVVADTRGGATGTVIVQLRTTAEKTALDALLDRVATLLLQGPAAQGEPDRYVRIGDHARVRLVNNGNFLTTRDTLPWAQVASPAGVQT